MTFTPRPPVGTGPIALRFKVSAETLVGLTALVPAGIAVWVTTLGSAFVVTVFAVAAFVLLAFGAIAWFRPLAGGIVLTVLGFFGVQGVMSYVAMAGDARLLGLFAIPTLAVPGAGVLFLVGGSYERKRKDDSKSTLKALSDTGYFGLADGPFLALANSVPELHGYESFIEWKQAYERQLELAGTPPADVAAAVANSDVYRAVEKASRAERLAWISANHDLANDALRAGYLHPSEEEAALIRFRG